MRSAHSIPLAIAVALLASAPAVNASGPNSATQASGIGNRTGSALRTQDKGRADPYSKLFEATELARQAVIEALKAQQPRTAQPKVVCGMIVIPGDPSIDPKIAAKLPKTDTRYTIRTVPPPACK